MASTTTSDNNEGGVLSLRVARPTKEAGKVDFETFEVDLAQKKSELHTKILTVAGVIPPEQLGVTLVHEHLLIDFQVAYTPPPPPAPHSLPEAANDSKDYQAKPIALETLGWIRQNPYSHPLNIHLDDIATAVQELAHYKRAGGHTIVDATTIGIGRNPLAMQSISTQSNVQIIMGAGFYVGASHPTEVSNFTEDDIMHLILSDLLHGVDNTTVRCGVIGEIGCSWPLQENEKKVLRAAAKAQKISGAPLLIHPARHQDSPIEIVKVLKEAGANIEKTSMSHIDRTIFEEGKLLELAETGIYLEYDLFGTEVSHYQLNELIDMPSDAQRIKWLKLLLDKGYLKKILISHDIHTKHRLVKYGGHGYHHILVNVLPKMLKRGFSESDIKTIIEENPKVWLSWE